MQFVQFVYFVNFHQFLWSAVLADFLAVVMVHDKQVVPPIRGVSSGGRFVKVKHNE